MTQDQVENDNSRGIPGENIVLFCYSLFSAVAGTFGNIFVIYEITKCKSFRMDKINLYFIKNVAISDLLYILTRIIPVSITNLTMDWIFGYNACFASSTLASISAIANMSFITGLTLHRLMMLYFPLCNNTVIRKHIQLICYIIWAYSSILWLQSIFIISTAVFVKQISTCIIQYSYSGVQNIIYSVIFILAPFSLIIFSNILLAIKTFLHVRKFRRNTHVRITRTGIKLMLERRQKQATLTVGSLSLLLILSWLPGLIKRFGGLKGSHPGLSKATIYLFFINSFGNPILYTLCSRDFKNVVQRSIKIWLNKVAIAARLYIHCKS